MTINFQALLDVAKATEQLPLGKFKMSVICRKTECGTAGCMIGNYNAMCGRPPEMFGIHDGVEILPLDRCDWHHFGITPEEYDWLFNARVAYRSETGDLIYRFTRSLEYVTQKQALTRLRKFIYYKLHKAEMSEEDSRHKEGNHNFAQRAVRESQLATCPGS